MNDLTELDKQSAVNLNDLANLGQIIGARAACYFCG